MTDVREFDAAHHLDNSAVIAAYLEEAFATGDNHLARLNTGDEFDALTRRGRRCHRFRPGTRARIKRNFRRRSRRVFKT